MNYQRMKKNIKKVYPITGTSSSPYYDTDSLLTKLINSLYQNNFFVND